MKILYVANVDWYFCLHWIERALAAKRAGYDVYVAVPEGESSQTIRRHGFNLVPIHLDRKSRGFWKEMRTFLSILATAKRLSPDLIHTLTVKPNIYGGLAGVFLDIPTIISITGLGHVFTQTTTRYRALRFFIKKIYKAIASLGRNTFLFENNEDYQLFLEGSVVAAGESRVILGAGVDLDQYEEKEFRLGCPRILFAARMLWDKGVQDILDAEQILRSRIPEFEICFAGILDEDSPGAINESEILDWHKQGRINWLGRSDDMPKLIESAQMSILPTCYGEGIPRFLIESASCGRPIIATDVAGCREIVIDGVNGLLVPPNDPKALADAVYSLIMDLDICRQMGRRGRSLVEAKMSNEIVIKATLETYRLCMSSPLLGK